MALHAPPFMYKRVWDPENMRYVHRNFQTGEGLWDNTKAFGRRLLSSNLFRSSKKAASDAVKRNLADAAESTAQSVIDRATATRQNIDRHSTKRNGKEKIVKLLENKPKSKNNRKTIVDEDPFSEDYF